MPQRTQRAQRKVLKTRIKTRKTAVDFYLNPPEQTLKSPMIRSIPHSQTVQRSRSGFTLIEIMLVLAIIAVLIGVAISQLTGSLDVAKNQRVDGDIQTITTQLKTYEMTNMFMPTTEQGLDALVNKPSRDPVPEHWTQLFKEIPLDPWGHPYQYLNPGKHNPNEFDLFSFGSSRHPEDLNEDGPTVIGNWKPAK